MILYQSRIYRADLRANPLVAYIFGDNIQRVGLGGQAREMRYEPNAIGIPTLHSPGHYFHDSDLEAVAPIIDHAVVFPLDGVGTGLACLQNQAPIIWERLCNKLGTLGIRNGNT